MKVALLTTDNREQSKSYSAPLPYFGTAPEALLQGFASLPEVEVHVVSCARAQMEPQQQLAPNIFFHSLHVPKLGWIRTGYQGCIRATRKKLKELQPDMVHGQGTEQDCSISAVFSGFPNVLTIHGNMRLIAKVNQVKPFSHTWLSARLEGFTLPRADGVVCITRYTEAAVRSLAKRTWVLPNAVDAAFFDLNPQPTAQAAPRVLCVGHICVRKNQNAFIRALDSLAGEYPLQLRFFGACSSGQAYDAEFLRLVRERPWCHYGAFLNRTQLRAEFAQAALVVLPSLEDNCPMVVLEAMAAGVPVVASKVGGVPDLIEEAKTGIFCDPLEAVSMRTAVERVLTDQQLARDLAKRARQAARERFHPRVVAQRHLQIYQEVRSSFS